MECRIIVKAFKLDRDKKQTKEIRMFRTNKQVIDFDGHFTPKIRKLFQMDEDATLEIFWKGR